MKELFFLQETSPHSVTDGDAIIAAIWCVRVELKECYEGKRIQPVWKTVCER